MVPTGFDEDMRAIAQAAVWSVLTDLIPEPREDIDAEKVNACLEKVQKALAEKVTNRDKRIFVALLEYTAAHARIWGANATEEFANRLRLRE